MQNQIQLPSYNINTKKTEKGIQVFDIIRKKYVVMTPEEEIRQRFIHFLIYEKKYPKGLLGVEVMLKIYNLTKRADIVLYNKNRGYDLLVECKAPNVSISQKTFDQITRYNMKFKANYLIVTNGINHYCCKINYEDNSYVFLKEIPEYNHI